MQGKITLEDHFATKTTLGDSHIFGAHVWSELGPRLLDFQDQRLRFMDAAGIEIMIASLNAPAIQAIPDIKRATEVTREANDVLAREIAKRPDRFVGVAALAMQDPDNAAAELERCVKDLGFRGALVNGFSQVGSPDTAVYYDLPQYRTFWRVVERLDVPFYLHPRNPLPGSMPRLRRTRLAARTELGVPCRDRGTRAAVDRQRPVRRVAAAADHSRPPRRGAAVLSVAYRQPEFLDEGAAQIRGAQTGGGLFPRQLPSSRRQVTSARLP